MTFTLISWAAIYFIVWWITLFVVLPFGVRSQTDEGEIIPGTEPGAPARLNLRRVFLITTAASIVVFAGIWLLLTQTAFGIDDIPFLPNFSRV